MGVPWTASQQAMAKHQFCPLKKLYITHLCSRDTQEAHGHQHPGDSHLVITKLDTIQVLHTQAPRRDQAVQREDLVHLDSSNERTTSLADDMRD